MTLGLAKLLAGSTLLTCLAYAQASSEPASSAIVSPSTSSIQPEPIKPDTSKPADADASIVADPISLLPDLPPVPRASATLVGGTIERLDRVRDEVTVRVFGGGRVKALFDPRTHVYRGSREVTIADLRQGERAYLDTILDGSTVFARSIRLNASTAQGESQGVVLKYRADRGEVTVRDALSPEPLQVRVTASTRFMQGNRSVSSSALVPGSLIAVTFDSQGNAHSVAREISILALPGTGYIFTGQVVHIDLRSGLLVINSSTDRKTYEVYLDSSSTPDDNLHPGSNVTVVANFENSRYVVRRVTINTP